MEQRKYDMEFVARVLKVFADYDDVGSLYWVTGEKYGGGQWDYPASFFANCSDCFGWGTADGEDITPENIHILEQSYADVKAITPVTCWAPSLFACRVRGMRPQGAAYPKDEPGLWPLFDACGPIRETGIGNPRPSPVAVGEVNELFCMGYADDFRDGIAYCVITTSLGPTDAELAASDLIDAGIRPRRRFECDIVDSVPCNFRAVTDVEIDEDRYREIDEMLDKAFPDKPQDDYP